MSEVVREAVIPETSLTPRELAEKILTQITEHPETHNQNDWEDAPCGNPGRCNTTRCVAGWAAHFAGHSVMEILEGEVEGHIEDVAGELLGLTPENAHNLFYRCTDPEAVEAMRYLAAGRPINWLEVGRVGRETEGSEGVSAP